jgi:hypothetical protein
MSQSIPVVFVKYGKWITATGKDPACSWELKPGAPKEAKKMLEEYKEKCREAYKKGIFL